MAGRTAQVNIEHFNANLVRFEQRVVQYGGRFDREIPKIAQDSQQIRTFVEEQKAAAKEAETAKLISGLGKVVETSINSVDDIASGEPARVMKGSLTVAISVAAVVGGPYGAAASAICGILGAVISLSSPKEPDLATRFAEMVRKELQLYHRKVKEEHFSGLQHRIKTMIYVLERFKDQGGNWDDMIDNLLYERDLPQFIGEVVHNISKGLSRDSKQEDCEDCVRSMVLYCNAQTSLLLLLANILATLKSADHPLRGIEGLFERERKNCREVLGFLSDENNLSPSAFLPTEGGKVFMIIALRNDAAAYISVDGFRETFGMRKMQDIDVIKEKVIAANFFGVRSIIELYQKPHQRGDHHYFQFINHTDLPVKVECGTAGDHVNGLKFCKDVLQRSSYEHIATKKTWNFSTAGYFIVYLDGVLRSYEKRFNDNIKVFEFSLSNPFMGSRKGAILEKTDNVFSVNGQDCWNKIGTYFGDPIIFTHAKKHYALKASLGGIIGDRGKNGCYTWRFAIQEFDPLEDMVEACVIL